jgi:DNA-binding MarR family transcriptional regulator
VTGWLTDEEQTAWRAWLLATQVVDEALDRQLQADAGMTHAHYGVLVVLSEAPGSALRMSECARTLRFSASRMSHAVASLERRGLVRRRSSTDDRRGQLAVLTAAGRAALEAAAPGHVGEVRRRVFDRLTASQVRQLREICEILSADR